MIRRALLFLALVAVGFVLLRVFLGETAFTARSTTNPRSTPNNPDRPPGGGIGLQSGQENSGGVTFSIAGAIELQRSHEAPLPDGSRLLLPTSRIKAKDSRPRPERDNLIELDDVTVEMFRILERQGAEPVAELAGRLEARSVLIEIERDAQGRPSLQEDRDMDVRDAIFRSAPAMGVPPMTLVVARARLRNGENQSTLTTAPDEAFTLTIGGDRPVTLVGDGLEATIPADAAGGPLDIRVLSNPVLTMDGGATVLRARGELRFVEQPDQSSTIDLHDDVSMQSQLLGKAAITARGDHLHGTLRRGRDQDAARKQQAQWSSVVLTGAPARVDGGEFVVEGDRLDVLPSLGTGTRLVTATGRPARLVLRTPGGGVSELTAEHRIHIVPLAQLHDETATAFGFPRGSLGARYAQLILFEGKTAVDLAQTDGRLTLTASGGLRVLRGTLPGSPTTLVGHGAVTAKLPSADLSVEGDDGFVLHDAQVGTTREIVLTLGSPTSARPRFDVRRGTELHVSGTGRCDLRQTIGAAGTRGRVELRSPTQDAIAVLPEGTLRQIQHLEATTTALGLEGFLAKGDACKLDATLADGTQITGEATSIRSDDGKEFLLVGLPARVLRAGEGEVLGDSIRVQPARRGVSLRAEGDARLVARLDPATATSAPADLHADRIVVAPWRAPPAAILWHASFLPPAAAVGFAASWRTPHVHAVRDVDLVLPGSGARPEHTRAQGHELWLALEPAAARGYLRGSPAMVTVDRDGQRTIGEAPTILFAQRGDRGTVSLLPLGAATPVLRLADAKGAKFAGLPAADVRALTISSAGPILVEDRTVSFRGPVHAIGAGEGDQGGFELHAQSMQMSRDDAGAIVQITAAGKVRFTSARLSGAGETLTLQLKRTLCIFEHPRGDARIVLDDGTSWRGNRIEVDYTSYTVRAWYGDLGSGEAR